VNLVFSQATEFGIGEGSACRNDEKGTKLHDQADLLLFENQDRVSFEVVYGGKYQTD
jgi:hypothetical protein